MSLSEIELSLSILFYVSSSEFQMSWMIDDLIGLLCVKCYSYVISLDYMRNLLNASFIIYIGVFVSYLL